MYVNTAKILEKKLASQPNVSLKNAFDILQENNTVVNQCEFMDLLRSFPNKVIKENLHYLDSIPKYGPEFKKQFARTSHMDSYELKSLYESTHDPDYLELSKLRDDSGYRKDKVLVELNLQRISRQMDPEVILEGGDFKYLHNEVDVIINNINYNPETVDLFQRIIQKVRMCKDPGFLETLPFVLIKTTELITSITITSIGPSYEALVCSVPEAVAYKVIDLKANRSQVQAYIKIFDKQISSIYRELSKGESRQYKFAMAYVDKLKDAMRILEKHLNVVKENIACMQPDIVAHEMYDESITEDVAAECEELLANMVFDDKDTTSNEQSLEALGRIYMAMLPKDFSVDVDMLEEAGGALARGAIRTANAAERGSQKIVSKMKEKKSLKDRILTPFKKIANPFINFVNNTFNKMKEMDSKARREKIITGKFKFKIYGMIRKVVKIFGTGLVGKLVSGIFLGPVGSAMVGAVCALISMIRQAALDKKLDNEERNKIINELETELKIVREKIEDSRGDSNKQAKYQLMRIERSLERDIARIKFAVKNA